MANFFENISVNPKDVQDLKELIPLTINQDEEFNKYTTLKKVKNGDPVALSEIWMMSVLLVEVVIPYTRRLAL